MPKFERSKDKPKRRSSSKSSSSNESRRSRAKSSGKEKPKRSGRSKYPMNGERSKGRNAQRPDRRDVVKERRGVKNRRDLEFTEVTCSSCGTECEVPFKPTSKKPVFCSDCFSDPKKEARTPKGSSVSEHDLDVINEKLNKIMKALKIR